MKAVEMVTLVLNGPQVMYILQRLSECPYREVGDLIADIQRQAQEQQPDEDGEDGEAGGLNADAD
jgi:hypothetical protein